MAPRVLTPTDLSVLQKIRRSCKPGCTRTSRRQTTIAALTGVSERTARQAYRRLHSWGYLYQTRRPILGGGRKPDLLDVPRQRRRSRTGKTEAAFAGSGGAGFAGSFISSDPIPVQGNQIERQQHPSMQAGLTPGVTAKQGESMPRPYKPTAADLDLITYNRLFREILDRGRVPVGPTALSEDRRHLKTLRQRIPDDRLREQFLRCYLSEDSKWLDERDYPLRYAVMAERYVKLYKEAADDLKPVEDEPTPTPTHRRSVAEFIEEGRRRREAAEKRKAEHAEAVKAFYAAEQRRSGRG